MHLPPTLAALLALVFTAVSGAAWAGPDRLPVSYRINSPLVVSDQSWEVVAYQAEDIAAARQQPAGEPGLVQQAQAGEVRWDRSYTFIAGEATTGRLAKHQNIGRPIWQIRELRGLEEGKLYRHPVHDEIQWSVKNLSVSLERGGRDAAVAGQEARHYVLRVAYDQFRRDGADGEEETDAVDSRRDLWFAGALPFSPVQLLPLHLAGSTFANHAPERVQEEVYSRLAGRLRELGMLVRTRLELGGKTYVVEVSRLEPAPRLELAGLEAMPAVPKSQVAAVQGPLFLAKMLQGSLPESGRADLRFGRGADAAPLEVSAGAGYALMDTGDVAVAAVFGGGQGPEGMLLLLRPHYGLPERGAHPASPRKGRKALQGLSRRELKEHARGFQAFALVEGQDGLTVYPEAVDGEVTITESGKDRLAGEFALTMQALQVPGEAEPARRRVSGSFSAPKGLDAQLRSPTSRLLR